MAIGPLPQFSFEEYLRLERNADTKHEFYAGQIYVMAGGTETHASLSFRVAFFLELRLAGRRRVYGGDLKVYSKAHDRCVYPDAMVICGPAEFLDERKDVITNPKVIIEVLSPSTEAYDSQDKLFLYRSLPSVRECLLIAQDKHHVVHLSRQENENWMLKDLDALEAKADLRSLDVDIALADIYRDIVL